MRRPEEVLVVVYRPAEPAFLVLERSPDRQGYWHLVAGALEDGEDAVAAAKRELLEETGLDAPVVDLGRTYRYPLDQEPPEVRTRFASNVAEIEVFAFAAEAPAGWEPALDEEHVGYRWCTRDDALRLLRYPEPRDAVERVARAVVGSRA